MADDVLRKTESMVDKALPVVLITGASSGIGAAFADRFARRGHPLILVARDTDRLGAKAGKLREETGVEVDVIRADLTNAEELALVESRLAEDANIGVLVNNAGAALPGSFLDQSADDVAGSVALNVTAVARLARAAAGNFVAKGEGAIVNVGSVLGLVPEFGMTIYGATKAFVQFLSQGLQAELGEKGVFVQAVLPGATRTEIWERSGRDIAALPAVMAVDDLVDAALVGFDRREDITIPALPDLAQWTAFNNARVAMIPNLSLAEPAARYRNPA